MGHVPDSAKLAKRIACQIDSGTIACGQRSIWMRPLPSQVGQPVAPQAVQSIQTGSCAVGGSTQRPPRQSLHRTPLRTAPAIFSFFGRPR